MKMWYLIMPHIPDTGPVNPGLPSLCIVYCIQYVYGTDSLEAERYWWTSQTTSSFTWHSLPLLPYLDTSCGVLKRVETASRTRTNLKTRSSLLLSSSNTTTATTITVRQRDSALLKMLLHMGECQPPDHPAHRSNISWHANQPTPPGPTLSK